MDEHARQKIKSYIFLILVGSILVLAALIIRPYIIPLISAFILAYLIRPIYTRIVRIMPPWCAALLCILLTLVVILAPISIIATAGIQQASDTLQNADVREALTELSNHPVIKQWNIDIVAVR